MAESQKYCGIYSFAAIELLFLLILVSGLANGFTRIDKLSILLMALNQGYRPKLLSSKLEWRNFEMFLFNICEERIF